MSALERVAEDPLGLIARKAGPNGWAVLVRTSKTLARAISRWRRGLGYSWPWPRLLSRRRELRLRAGRELSRAEAAELDDNSVAIFLDGDARPSYIVLAGLPRITASGVAGPLVGRLTVFDCGALTAWLRQPARIDAMPLLNDFATGARVVADLGDCAHCKNEHQEAMVAIDVCEICGDIMCSVCRESAVAAAGACIGCGDEVVCLACALEEPVDPGWEPGVTPLDTPGSVYRCSLCRMPWPKGPLNLSLVG